MDMVPENFSRMEMMNKYERAVWSYNSKIK